MQGRPAEAIVCLRDGLAGYAATGTALARPASTALLAHATAMTGRVAEGLELVAEGMADAERTTQRFHLVQLNMTRGDLLLWGGDPETAGPEAEACYRQALDLARSFDAPFHELRAATSLARLWMIRGRRAEAEALLRPLIARFTEGLELHDLRHAQAVLAQ